jgi:hypothetical protein
MRGRQCRIKVSLVPGLFNIKISCVLGVPVNLQRLFAGLRAQAYVALEAAITVLAFCGPTRSASAVYGCFKHLLTPRE